MKLKMDPARAVISILLIGTVLFSASCHLGKKDYSRVDGRYGYDCAAFEVPYVDESITYVTDVLRYNDVNYIVVLHGRDEDPNVINVYEVNDSGELLKTNELQNRSFLGPPVTAVIDGKLAFVNDDNSIDLYDFQDFSNRQSLISEESDPVCLYDTSDGFIVCMSGKIKRYYDDGREAVTVSDGLLSSYLAGRSFFEHDGHFYALVSTSGAYRYCEIDFTNKTVTELEDPRTIMPGVNGVSSDYVFTRSGIYKVDLEEKNAAVIADWNSLDERPEYKGLSGEEYVINDADHFAKIYSYMDSTCEVLLFSYNSEIDYSDRILLTVGGYNINYDLSLKWGRYLFNTSQDTYRVVTDDYSERFSWGDAREASQSTAALLQYFGEGNAPDIFYGDFFDYETLGTMGSVIDLRELMQADEFFYLEDYYYPTYSDEREIYSIYAAFNSGGMFGRSDLFEGNPEVSITQLDELSQETGITPMAPQFSANIVDSGIRNSLHERARNMTGEHVIPVEDLTGIIDFSVRHGVSDYSMVRFATLSDAADNQYLLGNDFINDIYSYNAARKVLDTDLIYIGYPSVEGSVHLISPFGMTAVSSSSEHPDACWDFIRCMLGPEVQKVLTANMMIPVNRSVLQMFVNYAVHPEDLPSDEITFGSIILQHDPVDEEIARQYMADLETLDTVQMLDWGVYNIIVDEVTSYDTQGKSPEEIAQTLAERLDLYVAENY